MKCKDCPLFDCYRDGYEYDEYDIRCLADYKSQDFPRGVDTETGGCKRTNKWILAQNKQDLELKHLDYDCRCWEEYMKENDPEGYKEHFGGEK